MPSLQIGKIRKQLIKTIHDIQDSCIFEHQLLIQDVNNLKMPIKSQSSI